MKTIHRIIAASALAILTHLASAAADIDLPACAAMEPGAANTVTLGVDPQSTAPEILDYVVRLARLSDQVGICTEAWPLPHWAPWAEVERGYGWGLFVLAFLITVGLCYRFTPRQWWNSPSLINLLALAVPTWLLGMGLLALFHLAGGQKLVYGALVGLHPAGQAQAEWLSVSTPRELEVALQQRKFFDLAPVQQQQIASSTPLPVMQPLPEGKYRVHQRLNLREKAGVDSARLATLPQGELVQFDGAREGDWWRIKTTAGQNGWVNSIWLRRLDEDAASGKS